MAELRVINCLPHDMCLYSGSLFSPDQGCSIGGTEVLRIPPSGFVATARSAIEEQPNLQICGVEVPTCSRSFSSITPLPQNGDFYIVSSVYAQAAAELGHNTSRLLVPYGVVKRNGRVIGCTALVRGLYKEDSA